MIDCPVPSQSYDRILLGHGSGGRLMSELVERVFVRGFGGDTLSRLEDQATVDPAGAGMRIAFTTDSFVVRPLFFPGGDIGKLAVHGTVNDLAVGGALPRYLAAAFILEEGAPIELLERIVASMRDACAHAGVELVTGDTKVVERGKGDEVFITTSGIGFVPRDRVLSISGARPGDCVLVSGPIGDHGIAVLSVREGLSFGTDLVSDTAPLHGLCEALLEACPETRCMRDPTRGGLASALSELAVASRVGVRMHETEVPVRPEVRAACDLLGLDPLHVACEGRLLAVVPGENAESAIAAMKRHPLGANAVAVGEIIESDPGRVLMVSQFGTLRRVSPLAGEQLPRIC